jgi:hypothetical protein
LIESKQKPRAQTTVLEPTLVVRASTQRKHAGKTGPGQTNSSPSGT